MFTYSSTAVCQVPCFELGIEWELRKHCCWFLGTYSLVREGPLSMAVEQTAPDWLSGESQHFLCSQSGGPGVGSGTEGGSALLQSDWGFIGRGTHTVTKAGAMCPGPPLWRWLGSPAFLYVASSGVDMFEMAPSLTYLEPRLGGWWEELRLVGCLFLSVQSRHVGFLRAWWSQSLVVLR